MDEQLTEILNGFIILDGEYKRELVDKADAIDSFFKERMPDLHWITADY